MAPYAVSGGRVERPRETRPMDLPNQRRQSTHGSRDPSRHRKSSDSPEKSADSSPKDPHTSRKSKYEPLRPTIRAVPPEGRRNSSRVVRDSRAAAAAALDGGGDTPDARLMGGERPGKDMARKKSKPAAGAASAATASTRHHHRSHRSRSGNGNRGGSKSKGKRPYSADSDELERPMNKRRCGKCFCTVQTGLF